MMQIGPETVWEYTEVVLIPLMFAVSIFFLVKAQKERAAGNPGTAKFDLGYGIFFAINAVNQIAYVSDSIWGFLPQFREILKREVTMIVFGFDIGLSSQIVFMMACFLWSFTPLIYPVEKFIQNSRKLILTKIAVVASGLVTVFWVVFYLLQVPLVNGVMDIFLAIVIVFVLLVCLVLLVLFLGVYIGVARKTPGSVRMKAITIASGIILMYASLLLGNLLRGEGLLPGYFILLGPALLTLGMLLLVVGFSKK